MGVLFGDAVEADQVDAADVVVFEVGDDGFALFDGFDDYVVEVGAGGRDGYVVFAFDGAEVAQAAEDSF